MKILILTILPFFVYGAQEWHKEILCDTETKTLLCEANEKISIERAFYGRSNEYECPSSNIKTTKCEAMDTLELVGNTCNGKTSCTISATTSFFGDPCDGTSKYLEVYYLCIRPSRIPTIVACEGDSVNIACPPGKSIKVKEGFYGRHDWSTCPHPSIYDIFCTTKNSLKIVRAICNGKNSCSVSAVNNLFGDPCRGTHKFLKVSYKCVGKTEENPCIDENGNRISGPPFEKPNDCDHFYQCSNGNLHIMPCAPGTAFNPEIDVCDWPHNVPGC